MEEKHINRWLILFASCAINLCIGSMYAWSSLSAPMASELGVESLAIVFSIANAVGFIAMIIGGYFNDHYGPGWVVFAGGIMFGAGMFTCGFAQSVGHLIISYGVCLGLGLSLVYGCTISNTIKFFPDRRGMAGGMTTGIYGLSSVIFAPVAAHLSGVVGARGTFEVLGGIFLVVICAGSFILKKCPEGYLPEGYVPPEADKASKKMDKSPLQMVRMPVFYVMMGILVAGGTFGMMIISSANGLAVNMIGAQASSAALFVSVLCLFNTAGRLIAGSVSDRLGRINTLTIALFIALAGLILLILAERHPAVPMFVAGIVLVGICFGTFMGVFPGFCTDRFGQKHNTMNYGIMWIGFAIAGIAGPMILSKVHAASGAYSLAFILAIAIAVFGLVMTIIYRRITEEG